MFCPQIQVCARLAQICLHMTLRSSGEVFQVSCGRNRDWNLAESLFRCKVFVQVPGSSSMGRSVVPYPSVCSEAMLSNFGIDSLKKHARNQAEVQGVSHACCCNMDGVKQYIVFLSDLARDTKLKVSRARTAQHRTQDVVIDSEKSTYPPMEQLLKEVDRGIYPRDAAGQSVAAAVLEPVCRHHALLQLSDMERLQRDVWRFLVCENLHGRIFYFRIVRLTKLRLPVPLTAAAFKYKRRFVGFVNQNWADLILQNDSVATEAERAWWATYVADTGLRVLLRLPRITA